MEVEIIHLFQPTTRGQNKLQCRLLWYCHDGSFICKCNSCFLCSGYGEGYTEIVVKGKLEDKKFLALYIKWVETRLWTMAMHLDQILVFLSFPLNL